MRASYDTTCDIINGPAMPSPGAVRHANVPCRVVDDGIVFQREKWLQLEVAYITMDESDVHAAFALITAPDYTIVVDQCDRIAIPSGAAASHTVLWTERVNVSTPGLYYRAHVKLGA